MHSNNLHFGNIIYTHNLTVKKYKLKTKREEKKKGKMEFGVEDMKEQIK